MLPVLKYFVLSSCNTCMVYLASSRQDTRAGGSAATFLNNVNASGITFPFEFIYLARDLQSHLQTITNKNCLMHVALGESNMSFDRAALSKVSESHQQFPDFLSLVRRSTSQKSC